MKFLVALSCLLAVASAGYAPYGVAAGVPLPVGDTYEVAAAKAAHFAAHAAARNQAYVGSVAPIAHAYASQARQVDPVAIAAGAPLPTGDTYEVAAAKAAHLQVHAAAKGLSYGAPAVGYTGYNGYTGYTGYTGYPVAPVVSQARQVDPVAIAAGAPLPTGDTYEVAAAKAAHLQAHAAAKGLSYGAPAVGYTGYTGYTGYPVVSQARQVDPVAIAAGAPLPTGDTYEVAAAKAAHLQAHAVAKGHFIGKRSPGYLSTAYTSPLAYTAPIRSYGYSAYTSPLAYSTPFYTHY